MMKCLMGRRILLTLLVMLSLGAGLIACLSLRYTPFTLVLQVKTLEKAAKALVVVDGEGRSKEVPFEIGNDSGDSSVYSFELPRTPVKKIIIPPLAEQGRYEIERITLSNDTISYRWDGVATCTTRLATDPIGLQTPCSQDSPVLNTGADAAVTIAGIPAMGVMAKSGAVAAEAITIALFLFLAGLWVLRPLPEAQTPTAGAVYFSRAGWLILFALYLYQLRYIWGYAVDLPFWEEWEFFEPAALQRGLSLEWLFCHFGTNQQVMVSTKLMAWLDYKLFSLDFVKLKVMNYLVFGMYLAVLARFARKISGDGFKFLPFFMLFLLSPLAYEAHAASFQSGEIFVLLFSMGMLRFSLTERPGYRDTALFSLCSLGALFSMHTGVAVAGILLLGRTVFIVARVATHELEKKKAAIDLLISWAITLSGIIYWLSGFKRPAGSAPPWLLPTEGKFWDQFFNLLGFGFGFDMANPVPGLICLLLLVVPVIFLLAQRHTRWQMTTWQIVPAILALLAITLMITLGRGNMAGSIKLSRYIVYISPLIPCGALAWWLVLKEEKHRRVVLTIFWAICFGAFADNWSYAIYRDLRQIDVMNLECVDNYNRGSGDGVCPGTHGVPIGGFFDNARKLDIHFTRQFGPALQPK